MSKLTVTIPDDLHQQIRDELERQGITTSQFIEQAIPFCVHPEKSALFASKRWASGTRQKPSRRASCIHKATTLMWKIHEQSNMAVCTAGRSLAAS